MESNSWQWVSTQDGSPSLAYQLGNQREAMHHQAGAFSETSYVYQPVVQLVGQLKLEPSFLSIGLGLGYNEFLVAMASLVSPKSAPVRLVSFESDPTLKKNIIAWVRQENSQLDPSYVKAYLKIEHQFESHFLVEASKIRMRLREWLDSGQWLIHSELNNHSLLKKSLGWPFSGVFYDAFSPGINEKLWDERFLSEFILHACNEVAVFATYASQGRLKRALLNNDFQVLQRRGFGGKRECTLALRGICPSASYISGLS